jgi:hypothetical protein
MSADPCRLCDLPHDGPRYIAGLGDHDWEPGWEAPRQPLPPAETYTDQLIAERHADGLDANGRTAQVPQPIPHPAGGITYPTDPHDPDGTRM